MFEYFQGIITAIYPTYVVLEVQHIGYHILVANPYRYQTDESIKLYIEQIIRDNDQSLYGFYDLAEKQLFLQLTSVSGIGPKSALAILADDDHSGLIEAISSDDVQFLTKFPGVGKKTAQQIVLDLKDKLPKTNLATNPTNLFSHVSTATANPAFDDGLAALAALGYSQKELQKIEAALSQVTAQSAGDYVRAGLKLLH